MFKVYGDNGYSCSCCHHEWAERFSEWECVLDFLAQKRFEEYHSQLIANPSDERWSFNKIITNVKSTVVIFGKEEIQEVEATIELTAEHESEIDARVAILVEKATAEKKIRDDAEKIAKRKRLEQELAQLDS